MYAKPLGVAAIAGFVLAAGLPSFAVPVYTGGMYRDSQVLTTGVAHSVSVAPESFEFEVRDSSSSEFPNSSGFLVGSTGVNSSSLLAAARSQIGWAQDCTALVENALRALGYSVGDLGPMGFAGLGVNVPVSEARAGDILVRGGHVAVYAGGGVAVHGGFNGTTVETSIDGDPSGFWVAVRL